MEGVSEEDKKFVTIELEAKEELELRVKEAEINTRKAAEYGQQLIHELSGIKLLKEQADQEIYELKNKLERSIQTYSSLEKYAAEDVEALKEANAKLIKDKETAEFHFKVKLDNVVEEQKTKEHEYETTVGELQESIKVFSGQLKEAQDLIMEYNSKEDTANKASGKL